MSRTLDDHLREWADGRASVLTRTRRLARALSIRVAEMRAEGDRTVAETPDILPFDAWLLREWERAGPDELLLEDTAETVLWESVISNDTSSTVDAPPTPILDVTGLAERARDAWKHMTLWGEPQWSRWPSTVETEAFRRWAAAFAGLLEEKSLVTRPQLVGLLMKRYQTGAVVPPANVALIGFGSLDDATEHLFQVVGEQKGASGEPVAVERYDNSSFAAVTPLVRCYATPAEEVIALAKSVRQECAQNRKGRIGVLCADFGTYRSLIEKNFTIELTPGTLLDGKERPRRFDLAGAPALNEYPMVAHALDLLTLGAAPLPFRLVSRILLSPYPHGDEEFEQRAIAEVLIRKKNRTALLLSGESGLAGMAERCNARRFAGRLRALVKLVEPASPGRKLHGSRARTPQEWCEAFAARLKAMNWPGSDLGELEGVVYNEWRDALIKLAGLETVQPSMTEHEALSRLKQLCAAATVQAPSPGLQVQAMGLLDSVGLEFESIYAVGFTSSVFPASASPSPLLPVAWQRSAGLPFSCAEIELKLADRLWQSMLRSAPRVTVSYARTGEGSEQRLASPHLGPLEVLPEPAVGDPAASLWYLADPALRENTTEARPPTSHVPARVLSGGTNLLRAQSLCPFSALAARRLKADPLEAPVPEPTALTRGTLVHDVLDRVWEQLVTSTALRSAGADALERLVAEASEKALAAASNVPKNLQPPVRDWLVDLCCAWLQYEKDRIGDWRVVGTETSARLELKAGSAGKTLHIEKMRIDRIDEDAAGDLTILDYKTGSDEKSYKAWIGERPLEPQLLLYVLSQLEHDRTVRAPAFANLVSREKLSLKGPPDVELVDSGRSGRVSKKSEWGSWSEELARCTSHLEALAGEYVAGEAPVAPLSWNQACKFCRRQALCRYFEGVDSDDEDEEASHP